MISSAGYSSKGYLWKSRHAHPFCESRNMNVFTNDKYCTLYTSVGKHCLLPNFNYLPYYIQLCLEKFLEGQFYISLDVDLIFMYILGYRIYICIECLFKNILLLYHTFICEFVLFHFHYFNNVLVIKLPCATSSTLFNE